MDRRAKVVSKAEFVWLLTRLGEIDRERYRELRERGWSEAQPQKSEPPN